MVEGVRQEAVSALLQQELRFTQQGAQDQAQPAAHIQQIEHQTQNVINEAHGAIYEVQGARQKNNEREREREREREGDDES